MTPTPRLAHEARSVTANFNSYMETSLEDRNMPALSILFDDVPNHGFNFASTVKAVIPLAFGTIDPKHRCDDALVDMASKLEATVGHLIEEHMLCPEVSRTRQAQVRAALSSPMERRGMLFMRRNGARDVPGQRFGKFLDEDYLTQCYKESREQSLDVTEPTELQQRDIDVADPTDLQQGGGVIRLHCPCSH